MPARTDTRQRLLDAARELFLAQGYAGTGIAQILRQAGARPGSLYHFFPTKEDLLLAVLLEYREMLRPELLDPIWRAVDDPIERVFGLLGGYRQ
ncbi:MAG: TetR family transcriptional regulator, partial [Xanthomonadales bacterium]|nr:TetR family transcriptional regulator [Xanthomonadales bacterium]NIN81834.1 TetR family transcriptional regulator [Stutzerimonas stutzeri]NIO13166.1 TetR family transcriptional regulator [Xanthomonadales bacterium]NIQ23679.1 TetR family transcriptional regulator [Stutzerimonas stutzeri]NIQ34946.1 TetR family transcriptional regulator [Xanthomonadales bacterium]